MASTHSYVQLNGQIYVGTSGVAASALVSSINELAKLDGAVNFELTFDQISAKWRTRVVQDRDTIAINGVCNLEGVQFRASTLSKLMSNVSTGTMQLYGSAATATASFWDIRASTAPKTVQLVFQFTRSSDSKKMQIWTKAQTANFPMPFAVDEYTKQSLQLNMIGSTNGGSFLKILKEL